MPAERQATRRPGTPGLPVVPGTRNAKRPDTEELAEVRVAGAATSDNVIDLYYSVAAPYRANGFWLASDSSMNAIRKLKDTTNNYLWAPGEWYGGGGIVQAAPDTLLGKPVATDAFVSAPGTAVKSLAFGDFSGYYIRDVRGVTFDRSDDYAFGSDLVSFRCLLRTDGNLVDLTGCVRAFRGGTA